MGRKRNPARKRSSRFCSFCKKSEPEVGRLIESARSDGQAPAYICRNCVEHAARVLENTKQRLGSEADQTVPGRITAVTGRSQLDLAVKNLSDQEFRVIELRYGLADGQEHSQEEVGKLLKLTPERVAEIEAAAVAKLKADGDST